MSFEDDYADVLQNIEFGIVTSWRSCPDLCDHDVMRVLEAVIDTYVAEKIGRQPRSFNLSDDEKLMMANVRRMCEWRLGRERVSDDPLMQEEVAPEPKTVDEILLCLKRIVKSVKSWNKSCGRQGYLNFVVQYVQ